MARPLVVGYGNSLRRDDGVGWHAAALLAADPRLAGCEVRQEFQLLPELAADVADASLLVLVDAAVDTEAPAGTVRVGPVEPPGRRTEGFSSHHLTPQALLGLAAELYGGCPPAVLVEVAAGDVGEGDRPSLAVAEALPEVIEAVVAIVDGRDPGA